MLAVGAAVDPVNNGGNFLPMLMNHGMLLSIIAFLFVFINLGSVCTHCLYNGAVGFSHLFSSKMRVWTLILGAIGGALALAGVWSKLPRMAEFARHRGTAVWCGHDR
ncbi:hypothetical protein LZ023_39385 (plasmid) [Pseudomonas silvicola]|nr:hypothetical protein LZ023_39385 [Pseudomonas silvicola]